MNVYHCLDEETNYRS